MTPRQRWLALLEGKPADRIPTDYQATDEVTARLLKDLGCNDEESLGVKPEMTQFLNKIDGYYN